MTFFNCAVLFSGLSLTDQKSYFSYVWDAKLSSRNP